MKEGQGDMRLIREDFLEHRQSHRSQWMWEAWQEAEKWQIYTTWKRRPKICIRMRTAQGRKDSIKILSPVRQHRPVVSGQVGKLPEGDGSNNGWETTSLQVMLGSASWKVHRWCVWKLRPRDIKLFFSLGYIVELDWHPVFLMPIPNWIAKYTRSDYYFYDYYQCLLWL